MLEYFSKLLDHSDFVPRPACGGWTESLILLHNISDGLIWLSYMAIPIILIYFISQRKDIPFQYIFWLFGAFIVTCGITHLLDILTFYIPHYRLSGFVKSITALVSVGTVVALIPTIPKVFAMRSPKEFEHELEQRKKAENEIRKLNEELEKRVHERTSELENQIAERKKTEAQLRQVIESMPNAIVMSDQNSKITLVNTLVEKLFGYDREELIGQPVDILVPKRFQKNHPQFREGFLHNPQSRAMGAGRDLYALKKDGSEIPVEIGINPIQTDQGLQVLSAIVDITERKKAEAQLRQVIESVPNALVMSDQNSKITLVNTMVEKLFGYNREELIGQPVDILVPQRFQKNHPQFREGFLHEPQSRAMGAGRDLYALKKDGTEMPVEIGLNPIQTDQGLQVLSAIVDITERKTTEKALEAHTKELARSNEELQQFAYVASHDLREPLRMVSSYVQLLEHRYKDKLDDDAKEFIHFAVDGAERLQTLIKDLLSFSRVGTRGKPFQPTNIQDMMDQVCSDLQFVIADHEAKIEYNNLPTVLADETQMSQVFQNLISNAIKFHSDEKPHIRVEAQLENQLWTFTISDNGIGIDPEFAERIFIIFQRLHTRDQYPGTGIGLAVCKKIVERHGGQIWIEPNTPKGTRVSFTIPERNTP